MSLADAHETQEEFLVSCGEYGSGIETLLEFFPESNILILWYDELKYAPETYLRRVQEFLGADTSFTPSILGQVSYSTKQARFPLLNRFIEETRSRDAHCRSCALCDGDETLVTRPETHIR